MKFYFQAMLTITGLGGALVLAKSGKGSKECATVSCCTANDQASLSQQFLVEFKEELPLPFCTSTKRQLELEFVVSYNFLARLNCDNPCFRRAKDARIVAAPKNAFLACPDASSQPPAEQAPSSGYGHRHLDVTGDNSFIVELDVEQAGACMTALDGTDGYGHASNPEEFQDACHHPAWAWDFTSPKEVCPYDAYNYDKQMSCCCVCGSDRSLSETDLAQILRHSQIMTTLGLQLDRLRELFARSDCSPETVEFSGGALLEFSGDASVLKDSSKAATLFQVVQGCYNALAFEECDELGRTISNGDVEPNSSSSSNSGLTNTRRRLQFGGRYANADLNGSIRCSSAVCPQVDDLDFFLGNTRRLESSVETENRVLSGSTPISSTPNEFISDNCLCPVHNKDSSGTAPQPADFIARFNTDLLATGVLPELGTLLSVTEYKVFSSAGIGRDYEVWLPIHVQGNACALDIYDLQDFAERVQEAYNIMVVEECDKPLFRNIVSAVTWMDPRLDCARNDFVVYVRLQVRCFGHCDPHNPLFSVYNKYYRRLNAPNTIEAVPYKSADYHSELEKPRDLASSGNAEDQEIRRMGKGYYDKSPGPDKICFTAGARNPMPPTMKGLETRVNDDLPAADITSISILTEPLCRCEGPSEYFYGGNPPLYFEHFLTQNGIYVVPNLTKKPCTTPVASAFRCFSS